SSENFPATFGPFQAAKPDGSAVTWFIAKFSSDGTQLVYSSLCCPISTYPVEAIRALAVDSSGAAYVTGNIGPSLPSTPGAYRPVAEGKYANPFVLKLDPSGSRIAYATFLTPAWITAPPPFNPAPALTYANAIATDADGNAYVGGTYIWKVNPRGSGLVFSAKPGGGSVNAIAIDQDRNVYVGGGAYTYPTFVTKFSADASQILYSAYLGGYYGEPVRSIAVDARGIAYAAGNTTSPTFPPRAPVEGSLLAFPSGFASALTTDGADLLFSTYLSDGRELEAVALALDPSGNPVVAGHNVGPPPYGYSRVPGADSDILVFAFHYF